MKHCGVVSVTCTELLKIMQTHRMHTVVDHNPACIGFVSAVYDDHETGTTRAIETVCGELSLQPVSDTRFIEVVVFSLFRRLSLRANRQWQLRARRRI